MKHIHTFENFLNESAFHAALAKAKEKGLKEFEFQGKKYPVKEEALEESELEEGGYFKGLSKSTSSRKKAQMRKQAEMPDDDPKAYKELPGDTKGKKLLKTSKHTKSYHELYGKNENINEGVGSGFEAATKNLSTSERNELIRLSKNVVDKAKKAGHSLYVNLRSYGWGDAIEFCIKHNHDNVEGSREHRFLQEFKYKVDRGVKITTKLEFDVTTGSWDGSWDEDTISVDKYFEIIE